jgi:hypothetical protein
MEIFSQWENSVEKVRAQKQSSSILLDEKLEKRMKGAKENNNILHAAYTWKSCIPISSRLLTKLHTRD